MNWIPAALLSTCVAAHAAAQSTPATLHAAWLRETLDLDMKAAASAYLELARDTKAPAIERQIAAARLEELRRVGAPAVGPDTAAETLPTNLRTANDPEAVEALRAAVAAALAHPIEPAAAQGAMDRDRESALPPLRPLVQFVLQAARETESQTRSPSGRFQPFMSGDSSRVIERIRAHEIARAEVGGRQQEADEIRQRAFPTWKAQPWPADKQAAWKTVRENLVRWQQERQISGTEREILTRLLTLLDADAGQSAEAALARVDRLPIYAERLRVGIAK